MPANPQLFKEVSPLSDKDCFIVIERQKSTFNFPIHIHPEYEINYIENAAGAQRIVGDSVEVIGAEELVLITNPTLEHAWVDHECQSQNIHEITIQFHSSALPDTLLDKNQFNSIRRMFERAQKGLVFGKSVLDRVRPLIKTISYESDSFYSLLKLWTILHELASSDDVRELASHSFINENKQQPAADSRINKVLAYLNNNYAQQIRLQEVADLINMSEASFCRYVKKRTSRSFIDLLNDIRIGYAIRSLVDSNHPVAEIGYNCGFNNLSNFNRIFRKKKGMTPTEFRNHYHKKKIIV